jgi:hypothetical protein
MKRFLTPLAGLVFLAGCFDADMKVEFLGGEDVKISAETTISRQLYDLGMAAEDDSDPCPDGEETISDDTFTCSFSERLTVGDLIAGEGFSEQGGMFDPNVGSSIQRLSGDRIEIVYDLRKMFEAAKEKDAAQRSDDGTSEIAVMMFADNAITFTVTADEIIETTGTLSADKKSATKEIPLSALMDPDYQFGAPFSTLLRAGEAQPEEERCWVGVWC